MTDKENKPFPIFLNFNILIHSIYINEDVKFSFILYIHIKI